MSLIASVGNVEIPTVQIHAVPGWHDASRAARWKSELNNCRNASVPVANEVQHRRFFDAGEEALRRHLRANSGILRIIVMTKETLADTRGAVAAVMTEEPLADVRGSVAAGKVIDWRAMISRRSFLASLPVAAAQIGKVKIKDVQVMMMKGDRTYSLIKITADNGVYGIAEAYGSPGIGVKEQILGLKPTLVGKDPLQIDTIYTGLGVGGTSLSGSRTDGSAHNLMRAASGIEMTLWDLAGKILGVPSSTLLGGRFRWRNCDRRNWM